MNENETKVAAARAMLQDLADESAALAMAAEEALAYATGAIDDNPNPLAALGTLTTAHAHLDAIQIAFTAAKALLMRARDGGR